MLKILIIPIILWLLYKLEGFVWNKYWYKNLTVTLNFENESSTEGENATLSEIITNSKLMPLHILQVRFQTAVGLVFADTPNATISDNVGVSDVFAMMPYEKVTRQLTINCEKRGYYEIMRTSIVSHDLFSSDIHYINMNQNTFMYVYPKYLDAASFNIPFERMMGEVISSSSLYEDNFTFRGIREYTRGDTPQSINWKATARTGELKVNLRDHTSSQKVNILVNLEEPAFLFDEELLEDCIRIAATLSAKFIGRQIQTEINTNGLDIITGEAVKVGAGASNSHITSVNKALARIDLKKDKASFADLIEDQLSKSKSDDTTYIIVSTSQRDNAVDKIIKLSNICGHLSWFCPLSPGMEVKDMQSDKIDFYKIIHR
ncbi:MAG: DUF58 domain-containing protein [Butyrivibrio sp.]|nr:DUF58 domain-containing protein [Butyrivibrio sp.]